MMINKILILFFLLFISVKGFATTQAIYWQKLMLEEKVQHKIGNSLGTVLADNQFLVDVEAEVDEPAAPNFGDNKGSGVRVTDSNLADSRGDYIAFSKVGLEVPVLDKYYDEEKTKLMNLYRFNEAYDVFKNLQNVKVTVYLSDSLPTELALIAEKVVKTTRLSLGTIKPNFKFEKLSLEWVDPAKKKEQEKAKATQEEKKKVEEPKEPKIWKKDWFEWASRWGNGIGLIFSALIFTYLGFSLFKRWKDYMDKMKAAEKAANEQVAVPESSGEKKEEEMNEEDDMALDNGFERFKLCLTQYPTEASNVSREWMAQNNEESKLALRAVAQQLGSDEFAGLLSSLGQEQRELWKSLIGAYLNALELKEANKIIARDVLKSLLVPSRVKDVALLNMLVELGPLKITQFLDRNESHAGLMLNLLSPSLTGSILAKITDQKAEQWLTAAAVFDVAQIEHQVPEFKKAIIEFKQSLAPSHFNGRLAELILTAAPSKERMLFKSIAKSSGADEVIKVAHRLFPSELLLNLPAAFLKETLQAYPMSKRLELILSQNDSNSQKLLEIFAEEGTTAREMMEMEMETVTNDVGMISSIKGRADDIWRNYVQFARQSLERAPQYRPDVEKLLKDWAGGLSKNLKIIGSDAAA